MRVTDAGQVANLCPEMVVCLLCVGDLRSMLGQWRELGLGSGRN